MLDPLRSTARFAAGLALALAASSPSASPAPATQAQASPAALPASRPFHLGFTSWPWDFTEEAVDDTYAFVADNADLLCLHHDGGVPWTEAAFGLPYHPAVLGTIAREAAGIAPGQAVFVSATAQSQLRAGELAPYWGAETGLPLPVFFEGRTLDDPLVVAAFTEWCRFLIESLDPDWFAYGIESNGGFTGLGDPGLAQFLAMAEAVRDALRAEYPDLPLLVTVQTASSAAPRREFLALTKEILAWSDYVGISTYPYLLQVEGGVEIHGDPAGLPANLLTAIKLLAPAKPVAITETGYTAEDLAIPAYGIASDGTAAWQAAYARWILAEAHALDAEFLVWFVSRDYDAGLATLESLGLPVDPAFLIWRDNGLVDGAGSPRPGLSAWRAWLALPRSGP